MLTLIGLGETCGDLSVAALHALREADEVIVRTDGLIQAQTLDDEHIAYTTLGALYEKSRSYDALARKIAAEVRRRAREKNVCYCTDGSVLEDAAALLLRKGKVKVFDGRSKSSYLAQRTGIGGDFLSASAFALPDELTLPLVVYDLTEDNVSDVKLKLAERFGDEAPAYLVGEKVEKIALYEADRIRFKAPGGLVVPSIPLLSKKRFGFEDAVAILRRLRAPDGCPWDKVQTHESIRINAIEEAYELVDAIDSDDPAKMCEEAGDVLMQALFHALLEEEAGRFSVGDMLTGLCEKLISRHTHVFGQDKASGAEGALSVWEKNKMKEKHQALFSDAVNDVPQCFPALLRAQKIAKRVEKGGWDKATLEAFEQKFREEYAELVEAYRAGAEGRVSEELGDVLFAAVELGRAVGADCEMSLLDTVKKVQARYTAYETLVRADGKDVLSLSREERDAYYRKAKDVCARA